MNCLQDRNLLVRVQAAKVLGGISDIRSAGPLIRALKDDNAYVRENAAKALTNIKDPTSIEYLIETLNDENSKVRDTALNALRVITGASEANTHREWLDWWDRNKKTFMLERETGSRSFGRR